MWKKKRNALCAFMSFLILFSGCAGNLPSEDMADDQTASSAAMSMVNPEETADISTANPTESSDVVTGESMVSTVYLDFCARKEQENREQMQEMLVGAREAVYDVLKAYDNAEMIEFSTPSAAEEIFVDGVIDEICGGNSVAKAAVSEAVECFKSGEGLGNSFGRTMNAAVEAIPGAAREQFVGMLVPGCVTKMLNLYNTLESNSNLQIKYAINKLQDSFQNDTQALITLLLEEDLTGDELRRIASLTSDIYNTVYELENRFQVSMALDEWWILNAYMEGIADEYYRCSFLATEYHRAGEEGADPSAAAFVGTEEEVRALIEELDYYFQDPDNFVTEYSWLLGLKQNLVTLKYFDYVQLQKDSTENFIAGTISNIFGNFITDMFAAKKTENDNIAVDVLYEYTDTCKQMLNQHIGGFDNLANINLEIYALYLELVNSRAVGGDEMRCALYFYQDYFDGELGPTYSFYEDRINDCAGEITAYYLLLKNTSSGQKALMNQKYLSNSDYLSELESELSWLQKTFYGENIPGLDLSVDISNEMSAVSEAYSNALQYLCIDSMRVNDVNKEEYTMNVEGRGLLALTCYRKSGLVSIYDTSGIEDAVIAMVLKIDGETVLTCTYDCESEIKSAYTPDGTFAQYGMDLMQLGIVDCNLSEEEMQTWDLQLKLAGAEIYSDMERAAEYMAICVDN